MYLVLPTLVLPSAICWRIPRIILGLKCFIIIETHFAELVWQLPVWVDKRLIEHYELLLLHHFILISALGMEKLSSILVPLEFLLFLSILEFFRLSNTEWFVDEVSL